MSKPHSVDCRCVQCSNDKPFTASEHLLSAFKSGEVVLFVGAGISTENPSRSHSTFYDEIKTDLKIVDKPPFSDLMSAYCKQPDGRIKLLQKIKARIDYHSSFDDLYRPIAQFHQSISPLHMVTDIITTNWDDFFHRECRFSEFIYDSDIAFWDAAKRRVIKIHGSISNFGSVVATASDYRKSFRRLNDGPLGAQLKSLIARKTVIYVGYSLSDDNYLRLLRNIAKMMSGNIRQSYFVSPKIDTDRLSKAPIPLIPIETDGTFFFEKMREELQDACGIIREIAFDRCNALLDDVADRHIKAADAFERTRHPLLIFILSYQDGLIHALQRINRMRTTGEYYSTERVHNLVHSYEWKSSELIRKKDFWNAAYAHGYENGLRFLLVNSAETPTTNPPLFEALLDKEFRSLAAVLRVDPKSIPRGMAAQARKILKKLPEGLELVPDHSPFL